MKQVKVTMVATGELIYKGILDESETYCFGYDATIPKMMFNLPTKFFNNTVFKVSETKLEDNVLELLVRYKDLNEELEVLTVDKLNIESSELSNGSKNYAIILNLIAANKESIDEVEVEFRTFTKGLLAKREEMLKVLKEDTDMETSLVRAEGKINIYGSMLAVTKRVKRMHTKSCRTGLWKHSVKLEGDYEQVDAEITLYRYLDSEFTMDDAKALNSNYKVLKNILER